MKNCIKKYLVEYFYDELVPEKRNEVSAHLESCKECASEYASIVKTLNKASELKMPVLTESLYEQVIERLIRKPLHLHRKWNIPFAVSFALLLILAIFSYSNQKSIEKDLEATYFLSTSVDIDSKEVSNLEVDMLADEVFLDDNISSTGGL